MHVVRAAQFAVACNFALTAIFFFCAALKVDMLTDAVDTWLTDELADEFTFDLHVVGSALFACIISALVLASLLAVQSVVEAAAVPTFRLASSGHRPELPAGATRPNPPASLLALLAAAPPEASHRRLLSLAAQLRRCGVHDDNAEAEGEGEGEGGADEGSASRLARRCGRPQLAAVLSAPPRGGSSFSRRSASQRRSTGYC